MRDLQNIRLDSKRVRTEYEIPYSETNHKIDCIIKYMDVFNKKLDALGLLVLNMQKKSLNKENKNNIDSLINGGYTLETCQTVINNLKSKGSIFERARKRSMSIKEESVISSKL